MNDCEIIERPAQPTAVLRATMPAGELPTFFDRAFGRIFADLAARQVVITGAPFAYFPRRPGDTVDVEAGVPVAQPIEDAGEVVAGELPGGRVAHTMHVGPYDQLPQAYQHLLEWMGERGLTPADSMWEIYLDDPSAQPDPTKWRTEIFWPTAG